MDSKNTSNANLKKYIKVQGKWRFVPVLNQSASFTRALSKSAAP
jgi:hypothetical protein